MARFITPFLHIGPTNVSNIAILQQSSALIGEIKYMINYDYMYELANSNTIGTIGDNNNVNMDGGNIDTNNGNEKIVQNIETDNIKVIKIDE